jgi:hypothetical protein
MEQREREQRARAADRLAEQQARSGLDTDDDPARGGRSLEEQEATAKALKPHARSIIDLEKLRLEPPEGRNTPHQPRKSRKWQFGIRSRNQPYEAMLYLYKAIAAQGGRWEIQPAESGQFVHSLNLHYIELTSLSAKALKLVPNLQMSLLRSKASTRIYLRTTIFPKIRGSYGLVS